MEPNDFFTQINDEKLKNISIENIAKGIKIFSFGLFKKVMLADVFATAVNYGFNNYKSMSSLDWILIAMFYTF